MGKFKNSKDELLRKLHEYLVGLNEMDQIPENKIRYASYGLIEEIEAVVEVENPVVIDTTNENAWLGASVGLCVLTSFARLMREKAEANG